MGPYWLPIGAGRPPHIPRSDETTVDSIKWPRTRKGRARRPALVNLTDGSGLALCPGPGTAAATRTTSGAGLRAGEGQGTGRRVTGDGERVAGLRRGEGQGPALVAGAGRRRRADVRPRRARGRAERVLDPGQNGRADAGVDAAVVGGVGLHRCLSRTRLLLGIGVVGLVPLVEERRDGDRGQQADDEHDDQQLDEREARLLAGHPLTELQQHLNLLGSLAARAPCLRESSTPVAARLALRSLSEPRWLCVPASRRVCLFHRGPGFWLTPASIGAPADAFSNRLKTADAETVVFASSDGRHSKTKGGPEGPPS